MAIAADSINTSRSAEAFNVGDGLEDIQFDTLFEQAVANIAEYMMDHSVTNQQEMGQSFDGQNLMNNPTSAIDQQAMTLGSQCMPEQKYRPNESASYQNMQSVGVLGKMFKYEPVENNSPPGMNKTNQKIEIYFINKLIFHVFSLFRYFARSISGKVGGYGKMVQRSHQSA